MRYQVPQFVDIEDKIVGPFTLRQFFMYLGAVLLMIPIYILSDLGLFIALAIPVIGTAVLFAHLKIHGKSLASVIGNAIAFYLRGEFFVWRRTPEPKWLKISGEEYGNFSPEMAAGSVEVSDLSARARALETEGHITTEDIEDPLTAEA